jgi:hypothetical protein
LYDLHFKCRARRAPLPCKSRRARAVTFGSLHVFVERNSVERRNNQAPVGILTENGGKDHVVEQLEQKLWKTLPTLHRMLGAEFESWQRKRSWRLCTFAIMRITDPRKIGDATLPRGWGAPNQNRVALAGYG